MPKQTILSKAAQSLTLAVLVAERFSRCLTSQVFTDGSVGCYRKGGKRRQLKGKGSKRKGRKGCSNWSSSFRDWNKILLLPLLLLLLALKLRISLGMGKSLIWTQLRLLGTGAALKMMMTMMRRIMLTRMVRFDLCNCTLTALSEHADLQAY